MAIIDWCPEDGYVDLSIVILPILVGILIGYGIGYWFSKRIIKRLENER